MDIMVRYWDVHAKRVEVRYWHSMFLGHTTHLDLLNRFFEGLEGLDVTKLLQVSMDGPNTNLLFLKKLKKERIDNELNGIIEKGSCSLHIVHGAYKTGAEKTDWNLHKVMKGSYFLLHDSPAWREDYVNLTGGSSYPLQFCGTRWVEDKKVADHLIDIWGNMRKLYDYWEGLVKSKRPSSKSYENVKAGINDKLVIAKLHFFLYLAGLLKPFLTCYQGDGPTVSFLCNDLAAAYRSLLELV